jgi:hypothetical protein
MSVWKSEEALRDYCYKTAHAEMLRGKEEWIDHFDRAHLALWWIPVGHIPTISESAERLRALHAQGATLYAFTLHECY